MVPRNDSDQLVRNVSGQVSNVGGQVSSEMVRNVSGRKLCNVGGFRVRVRNVSGSGSVKVSDVGHHVPLLTDVGAQGTNYISV